MIFQAGASARGLEFAARHAEVVFVNGMNPQALRANVDRLRDAAERAGRGRHDIKVVTDMSAVVGRTRAEAEEKANAVRAAQSAQAQYAAFGGASGYDLSIYDDDDILGQEPGKNFSRSEAARFTSEITRLDTVGQIKKRLINLSPYASTMVGTPQDIADEIERVAEITDVDGFNHHEFVTPMTSTNLPPRSCPFWRRAVCLNVPNRPARCGNGCSARATGYPIAIPPRNIAARFKIPKRNPP